MASDPEAVQGELFNRFAAPDKQRSFKTKFKLKTLGNFTLVLPYENLVFLTIISIMALVVTFSLGVEQGKNWRAQTGILAGEPVATMKQPLVVEVPVQKTAASEAQKNPEPTSQPGVSSHVQPASKPVKKPRSIPAYTIQLITFQREETALDESERLKKEGYKPFINSRGGYFEICVGEYPDAKAAKTVLAKFQKSKSYHDAYLRKLD